MFTQIHSDYSSEESEEEPVNASKMINQYLVLDKLGSGTFAKVYLAYDTQKKIHVALKRFNLPELQNMQFGISQLKRELVIMKKMHHMNILAMHEILYDDQKHLVYTVLDYADCGSLESQTDLQPNEIKSIYYQVLTGLSYIHGLKMVHQDMKPSNILLCSDGRVLISDFGVGHSFQSTDMFLGSPAFQAPELLGDSKSEDPTKEDVWSVGVSLYQTLFNRLPFEGDTLYEIIRNEMTSKLVIPECSDRAAADLLVEMLEVNPKMRISIAEAMEHPFFAHRSDEAPDFSRLKKTIPTPKKRGLVNQIHAKVCNDSLSFIPPDLTLPTVLRGMRKTTE